MTGHPPWHEFEGVAAIFKIATHPHPHYLLPQDASLSVRVCGGGGCGGGGCGGGGFGGCGCGGVGLFVVW